MLKYALYPPKIIQLLIVLKCYSMESVDILNFKPFFILTSTLLKCLHFERILKNISNY